MILYFSGCGNSFFVARQLSSLIDSALVKINPADPSPALTLSEGEPLGSVCPVYAWAVPRLVSDYVSRIQSCQRPAYCFLACTCGDNVGRTPERFAKVLQRKGWQLDAAFSFVMPETYINLPGFNIDSPEKEQRKISAVRQRLPEVAARIKNREHVIDVVRGKIPRFNSYVTNALFYGLLITDRKFRVNGDCISCGLCEKSCPLGNISLVDGRPQWHGNCTNCLSFYHRCPMNAINFGKATVGKGQYIFKEEK